MAKQCKNRGLSKQHVLTIILTVFLVAVFNFSKATYAQELRIYFIDVDQADATLLVAPNGQSLLIDSGENGMGQRILDVLREAGVDRIDNLVTTHYHRDHYGAIDEIVNSGIMVIQSYDRGNKSQESGPRYEEYQTAVGDDALPVTPGMVITLDDNLTVTFLASSGEVLNDPDPLDTGEENNNSVAMLIEFGDFRLFIGGDIHHQIEEKIADQGFVDNLNIYQANHHGSETSSDQDFLEAMAPQVIIISNGSHGSHHHPRDTVLTRMGNLDPRPVILQTNKYLDGDSRGGNVDDFFIADLDTQGDEGTIIVTVDLETGTYTLSYREGRISINFPIGVADNPPANETAGVVIESLLPNPVGSDLDLEAVTIRNDTTQEIPLSGWILRDQANLGWSLDDVGSLLPGQIVTVIRDRQPMSLNNGGDLIELLDAEGNVRDSFQYWESSEGILVETGH